MTLSKALFQAFIYAAFLCLSFTYTASEDNTDTGTRTVCEVSDLQALTPAMQKKQLGLVLMFHAEHCEYCRRLEAELLGPMAFSGRYDDRVLIRKLETGSQDIINFNGQTLTGSQLATMYNAQLTPTLVFVGSDGMKHAKNLPGYTTPELFGAYLERSIRDLLREVRKAS